MSSKASKIAVTPSKNAAQLRNKVVPCPVCSIQIGLEYASAHIQVRHPELDLNAAMTQLYELYGNPAQEIAIRQEHRKVV